MLGPVHWTLTKRFLPRKAGGGTAMWGTGATSGAQSTSPPSEGSPRRAGGKGASGGHGARVLALRWLWGLGVHLCIWQKRVFPTG